MTSLLAISQKLGKELDLAAEARRQKSLPPVEKWNPPSCGDIGMKIGRDGTWYYQNSPIGRAKLVQLFSTILRRDADGYYLVTPVEKVPVEVEDMPFLAVLMRVEKRNNEQSLFFTTNVGDEVLAGKAHPLACPIDPATQEPHPFIHIRGGLDARIARAVFYDLVALGEEGEKDGEAFFGVRSGGQFFPFTPRASVPRL